MGEAELRALSRRSLRGLARTSSALDTAGAKPWFTEEFGWPQAVGDDVRAGNFEWLYGEQQTYGSDGSLFWNLGAEVVGGSHDVNPSTGSTWAVVVAHKGGS